jgi:hypothetical protein
MARCRGLAGIVVLSVLSMGSVALAQGGAAPPPMGSRDETRAIDKPAPRPDIVVEAPGQFQEEKPVGPSNQPEWTTCRRFPSTRVYIQTLPGEADFEQWVEVNVPKDRSKSAETIMREEFTFGLAERLQFDLYACSVHNRDGAKSSIEFLEWSAELRYAFADWNVIPGNPTLYVEYVFGNDAPDALETKLLLGGSLAPGWHWGANIISERELAGTGDRDEEYSVTGGVSKTVIDRSLSLGAEVQATYASEHNDSNAERDHKVEVMIGPSLQWRPNPKCSFDLTPFFGITGDAARTYTYLIFRWSF